MKMSDGLFLKVSGPAGLLGQSPADPHQVLRSSASDLQADVCLNAMDSKSTVCHAGVPGCGKTIPLNQE